MHSNEVDPPLSLPQLADGDYYAFHTMIKPSGAQCNQDCAYCFYLHKEDLLRQGKVPRMSESLLEAHIRQYLAAQTGPVAVFTWQGGEPTLMGLDFFHRIVELQARYARAGQRVENDLQTNGALLTAEWCAFLKQHDFVVGLSIDGPEELHNIYRYSKGGKPTFDRVMNAVELLHRYNIRFNALCVVNNKNINSPLPVYEFLRDQVRPYVIQFLPAVEPINFQNTAPGYWELSTLPISGTSRAKPGQPDSVVAEWSVSPDDWGHFLTQIWDVWLSEDFGSVFVDQFENVISQMLGRGAQSCVSGQICGKAIAIEHNGDVYSCDRFVYPEYRLGNILHVHQGEMAFSERQKEFGYAKHKSLPKYCKTCSYLKLCWGECPKNRFVRTPDGEAGLNYLCPGLKIFYKKTLADLPVILRRLKAR
ncbi:anaerobic sulfatase maturase [Aeromonas veronii]|uniref:anaerobic sulfatase maturase n=1 Tax=Aeromonas TaxID=642 RepID=UPI000A01B7AC|nr:anaerobic sulfatase maturase [Aeromonas fluvialis]